MSQGCTGTHSIRTKIRERFTSFTAAHWDFAVQFYNVNMCRRLRDSWGRFTGEINIFRKAAEGLFVPAPKTGPASFRGLAPTGGAPMWADPPEFSNVSELESRCRGAGAHTSSLRPCLRGLLLSIILGMPANMSGWGLGKRLLAGCIAERFRVILSP